MNKYVIGVLAGLLLGGVAWAQSALPVMELTAGTVSYTHLTLPTKRIV